MIEAWFLDHVPHLLPLLLLWQQPQSDCRISQLELRYMPVCPCSVPDSFGDAPLMRQLRLCDRWLQSRPLQGDGSKWLQWSLLRHRSCQVFVKQSCKVAPRPTGELCPAVWTESVFDCSFILCVGRGFSSVWLCFCWTACKPTDSGLRYLVHQRWDVLVTWFIQDVLGPSREPHIHRLALHLRRHHLAS